MSRSLRPVAAIAAVVGVVLLVLSGRYGYHRDELYFLEAGRHLAWGYPDQPPLVPLLARLMDTLVPGSLVALRLPSALAASTVVLLTGVLARDLGARRSGQVVAAVAAGLCGFVLATGHLLSTATFSLLGWTVATVLLVRVLRTPTWRTWVLLGLVAGLTMQVNVLVLALVAAFGVAVLLVGPRALFAQAGPYVAVGLALLVASPYLVWQAQHGFPQLDVASNIADGGSGSSESRWAFLPFQVLQVGPWLAPIWVVGLVRLWRDQALRSLAAAYVVLVVVLIVGGGKPYYLSGLYPLLLAAGAQPLLDRVRGWVVPALLALSTPVLVLVLPVLPVRDAEIALAVNEDAGETIGWKDYVRQIADAYDELPGGTAILTANYGEAGAVDRYGPDLGLPEAHSGHNGYGRWGAPPGSSPALVVGIDASHLAGRCTEVREIGRLREVHGIENDEDGAPLVFCVAPVRPWDELWSGMVRVG